MVAEGHLKHNQEKSYIGGAMRLMRSFWPSVFTLTLLFVGQILKHHIQANRRSPENRASQAISKQNSGFIVIVVTGQILIFTLVTEF
ncbi:hypothetical protein HZ326_23244 [Fusarium oxysporum f. sp. albedinis]|nr:hypothetical protein HZ326_23244 [Fusarium oxysporum f. sp. albedinis]